MRAKIQRQTGNVHIGQFTFFAILCMSKNDHYSSMSTDWFGVKSKFSQVGKSANTETMNNEDQL